MSSCCSRPFRDADGQWRPGADAADWHTFQDVLKAVPEHDLLPDPGTAIYAGVHS
jgi:hypothetical protein